IPAEGAPQPFAGLQGDLVRMSDRIEKMREDFSTRSAARAGDDESIDQLRREVAAVSRGLS
ncbi:MAG: hypothetical protein KDJ20_13270, partial [Hyphomicrobiales bacterium]|nr:hypothetical protein [Hyphomicrobiales bacterium]